MGALTYHMRWLPLCFLAFSTGNPHPQLQGTLQEFFITPGIIQLRIVMKPRQPCMSPFTYA